jgi:hypothetical protein
VLNIYAAELLRIPAVARRILPVLAALTTLSDHSTAYYC